MFVGRTYVVGQTLLQIEFVARWLRLLGECKLAESSLVGRKDTF